MTYHTIFTVLPRSSGWLSMYSHWKNKVRYDKWGTISLFLFFGLGWPIRCYYFKQYGWALSSLQTMLDLGVVMLSHL